MGMEKTTSKTFVIYLNEKYHNKYGGMRAIVLIYCYSMNSKIIVYKCRLFLKKDHKKIPGHIFAPFPRQDLNISWSF